MKNKQTAVDWLVEQIKSDQNQKALSANEWMQVIEQAKQMEKQQIIDADLAGVKRTALNVHNNLIKIPEIINKIGCMENGILNHENGEQYYNEIYEK